MSDKDKSSSENTPPNPTSPSRRSRRPSRGQAASRQSEPAPTVSTDNSGALEEALADAKAEVKRLRAMLASTQEESKQEAERLKEGVKQETEKLNQEAKKLNQEAKKLNQEVDRQRTRAEKWERRAIEAEKKSKEIKPTRHSEPSCSTLHLGTPTPHNSSQAPSCPGESMDPPLSISPPSDDSGDQDQERFSPRTLTSDSEGDFEEDSEKGVSTSSTSGEDQGSSYTDSGDENEPSEHCGGVCVGSDCGCHHEPNTRACKKGSPSDRTTVLIDDLQACCTDCRKRLGYYNE